MKILVKTVLLSIVCSLSLQAHSGDLELKNVQDCGAAIRGSGSNVFEPLRAYFVDKASTQLIAFRGKREGTFWTASPMQGLDKNSSQLIAQMEKSGAMVELKVRELVAAIKAGDLEELSLSRNQVIKVDGQGVRKDVLLLHWTDQPNENLTLKHHLDSGSEDHEELLIDSLLHAEDGILGAEEMVTSQNLLTIWILSQYARHPKGRQILLNSMGEGDFDSALEKADLLVKLERNEARQFFYQLTSKTLEALSTQRSLEEAWLAEPDIEDSQDLGGEFSQVAFWDNFFTPEEAKSLKPKMKFTKSMKKELTKLGPGRQGKIKQHLFSVVKTLEGGVDAMREDSSWTQFDNKTGVNVPFPIYKFRCNCKGGEKRLFFILGKNNLIYMYKLTHRNNGYPMKLQKAIVEQAIKARQELVERGLVDPVKDGEK